jgi:transcriptional regulator with XRE-family HTH domain
MMTVDKDWFQDRLAIKRITQKEFGNQLGMDASSVSLMLAGKRAITIDRAAQMSRILGVSLEEVSQRAGIPNVEAVGDRVVICGHIDGDSRVTLVPEPTGWTVSPGNLPAGSMALVMRTTMSELDMLNGWVAFTGPLDENVVDAVDRTCIVKIKGERAPFMRLIRRGGAPGIYTLTGIGQPPMHDVEIEWIRPVLLFRPI